MNSDNISSTTSKDIMFNLFPKKEPVIPSTPPQKNVPFTNMERYHNHRHHEKNPSEASVADNSMKKWYIAIVIGVFAAILLSSFSLDFIDEFCAQKNVAAFDTKGNPNMKLMVVLLLFLIAFIRSMLMLL